MLAVLTLRRRSCHSKRFGRILYILHIDEVNSKDLSFPSPVIDPVSR